MLLSEFFVPVRDGYFDSLRLLADSGGEAQLVFIGDEKWMGLLSERVTCVITNRELAASIPKSMGLVISEYPKRAFTELHNKLAKSGFYGSDFQSFISPSAIISPDAYISSTNVVVGDRCEVGRKAVILRGVIGNDVKIGPGTVIGAPATQAIREGNMLMVEHVGGVIIHDRVEVLANCVISRALIGNTEIDEDTKIDNQVYISHNAKIGKRCLVIGCAMICGSATIGDDVWVGPHATVSSCIKVGDRANITIGAVVTRDVQADMRVTGNFAIDHDRFVSNLKTIR